MPMLVGTSGWQYRDWRGVLYPPGLPLARWLEYYASQFPTVENNGTFYRLAAPETFADWRSRTPEGFLMAVKASRYLTHIRRLRDPDEPVSRLLTAAAGLRDRLGPVLLQLPPSLPADPEALERCLAQFEAHAPAETGPVRVCVEFRHASWWTDPVMQLLRRHNAATCWADRGGRPTGPLWLTADWGYLRLHEGAASPWPRYGRQSLQSWLRRITEGFPPTADFFAYFNNDQLGAAPADAQALARLAERAGWPVRRSRG